MFIVWCSVFVALLFCVVRYGCKLSFVVCSMFVCVVVVVAAVVVVIVVVVDVVVVILIVFIVL